MELNDSEKEASISFFSEFIYICNEEFEHEYLVDKKNIGQCYVCDD